MLLSTHFQKPLIYLAVMTVTLFSGWHAISQAEEASLEETLADNVVFFKVKSDTLIHESTTQESRKLGKIPAEQSCVAYLSEKKDVGSQKWVKIVYKGVQGWVNLGDVKRDWESPCGKYYQITNVPRNEVLNMRESPTSDKTVGKIPYDYEDCLTGLGENKKLAEKQWVLLDYEGTKGWVDSKSLKTISVDDCDI